MLPALSLSLFSTLSALSSRQAPVHQAVTPPAFRNLLPHSPAFLYTVSSSVLSWWRRLFPCCFGHLSTTDVRGQRRTYCQFKGISTRSSPCGLQDQSESMASDFQGRWRYGAGAGPTQNWRQSLARTTVPQSASHAPPAGSSPGFVPSLTLPDGMPSAPTVIWPLSLSISETPAPDGRVGLRTGATGRCCARSPLTWGYRMFFSQAPGLH